MRARPAVPRAQAAMKLWPGPAEPRRLTTRPHAGGRSENRHGIAAQRLGEVPAERVHGQPVEVLAPLPVLGAAWRESVVIADEYRDSLRDAVLEGIAGGMTPAE